jgi:hypothetical protein
MLGFEQGTAHFISPELAEQEELEMTLYQQTSRLNSYHFCYSLFFPKKQKAKVNKS